MRRARVLFTICVAGCGSPESPVSDASPAGEVDAEPGCTPTTLLVGGTDVTAQGWSVVMQAPSVLSYERDHVRLQTSTPGGATTSGHLLLHHPGALEVGKPFTLQVVMLVEQVDPHGQYDSAAAILGSFTPPFGVSGERNQMIYLDAGAIGWADDGQAFTTSVQDGAYHTYELSVDAAGIARVTIDGVAALTRAGFVINGAIAVGDQTNEKGVDSALRIRSVTKLCP